MGDTRTVTQVRVVAHAAGRQGISPMCDNHWSIFFLLSSGGSVRANMATPDPAITRGNLVWRSLEYTESHSAIRQWDWNVIAYGVTVNSIYQLLIGRGRQNYQMSGGGSGCRWWCWIIISDLAMAGYIASTAPTVLYPDLLHLYSKSGPTRPLDMVEGRFDDEADD